MVTNRICLASDHCRFLSLFLPSILSYCQKPYGITAWPFDSYPDLMLVSFTIDPKRDTPERLHLYAQNLEVDPKRWCFWPVRKRWIACHIQRLCEHCIGGSDAPGGFRPQRKIDSGWQNAHVRSFCNGTDPKVDRFHGKMYNGYWIMAVNKYAYRFFSFFFGGSLAAVSTRKGESRCMQRNCVQLPYGWRRQAAVSRHQCDLCWVQFAKAGSGTRLPIV